MSNGSENPQLSPFRKAQGVLTRHDVMENGVLTSELGSDLWNEVHALVDPDHCCIGLTDHMLGVHRLPRSGMCKCMIVNVLQCSDLTQLSSRPVEQTKRARSHELCSDRLQTLWRLRREAVAQVHQRQKRHQN